MSPVRAASVWCLLLATPVPAAAQGVANTLQELRLLVRPGDTVTVRDAAGVASKGKILSLSPSSIVLNGRERREFLEANITDIRQRRGDSLQNGALWGLGIAAGLMTLAVASICEDDCDAGWVVTGIAVYSGLGAAIGVGIDALITTEYVVYQRQAKSLGWRVSPLLTPRRQGLAVTFSFN